MPVHTIREYMQVYGYGTSEGVEKAWDTRGRGRHTLSETLKTRFLRRQSDLNRIGDEYGDPCTEQDDTKDCHELADALKAWSGGSEASRVMSVRAQDLIENKLGQEPDDLFVRHARALINGIRTAPEQDGALWRGLHPHEVARLMKSHLAVGDEFELRAPKAFSWKKNIAKSFSGTVPGKPYTVRMLLHIVGPVKAVNTASVSGFPEEAEAITGGRFKVDSIVPAEKDSANNFTVYHLHQTGVF